MIKKWRNNNKGREISYHCKWPNYVLRKPKKKNAKNITSSEWYERNSRIRDEVIKIKLSVKTAREFIIKEILPIVVTGDVQCLEVNLVWNTWHWFQWHCKTMKENLKQVKLYASPLLGRVKQRWQPLSTD